MVGLIYWLNHVESTFFPAEIPPHLVSTRGGPLHRRAACGFGAAGGAVEASASLTEILHFRNTKIVAFSWENVSSIFIECVFVLDFSNFF